MARRHALTMALALLAGACADEVDRVDPDAWVLSVVAGAGQEDTIQAVLQDRITVRLIDGSGDGSAAILEPGLGPDPLPDGHGAPVPDQDVCWQVPDSTWGSVMPACDRTDSTGIASTTWTLGTLARDSVYSVAHAFYFNRPEASDTVWASIRPGRWAASFYLNTGFDSFGGDYVPFLASSRHVTDREGNRVPYTFAADCCVYPLGASGDSARTLTADSAGTFPVYVIELATGDTVTMIQAEVTGPYDDSYPGEWYLELLPAG